MAAPHSPLPTSLMTMRNRPRISFALSIGLAVFFNTSSSMAQTPTVEPLDLAINFTPSISFSETHSESVVKSVDPFDSTNVSYDVWYTESTTATIVANITGIVLADIDETTNVAINIGAAQGTFALGDIPTYKAGQTTAFYCWNGWDDNNKALGTGGVRLTWTATKLPVTVTMGNEVSRPTAVDADSYVGQETTPGTYPIKGTVGASISFGPISTTVNRNLYTTGSYVVTHKTAGPVDAPLYDYFLYSVTESGSADYTRPTVALTSPKQNAIVTGTVEIKGTAADARGLYGVEWSSDFSPDWLAADDFTISTAPADGSWGTTTAKWTIGLLSVPHGTRHIYVRSIDDSGNTSTPVAISLVRSMPTVLTGRWDALLEPDAINGMRGAIHFTFSANGSYTGTLVLEGISYNFTNSLLPDESLGHTITRAKPLHPIVLGGLVVSFEPNGEGMAAITGDLEIDGTAVATFAAYRSPWTTAKLADATLAGNFHVNIDPATTPIGNSYAIVTTARSGTATAAMSMADGSVVTWSGVMGANGDLPVFAPLYVKGSVSAAMKINGSARAVDATTVTWNRPAAVSDKQFPAGFLYTDLAASGSVYVAPSPATVRVMGLAATADNATATWSGDGVTDHTQTFTVNASNTTTIVSPVDALKLTVTGSTGVWAGSFKIPGTTVLSTCKLLIVGNEAWGQWSAAAPTGSTLKRYGVIHIK